MHPVVDEFVQFYESLGAQSTVDLTPVYADNVEFIDPVHRMQGLPALDHYFNELMTNVASLEFRITEKDVSEEQAFLQWIMSYQHPKLAGGQAIDVAGISHIRFDEKIFYHRDYYDLGEMLYEHIPLYGWITRRLKARLAG